MNLNIKLEEEEDQAVQYVNRFAINIPSGTPALSLNIVNPGLSGQSYILNPVNSVGQNIVTYQPVQSYIALPAESEGNLIHGLPVGVPVPVGLPVSAGILPNHNFMNSIIIRNEDTPNVIKSPNNANSENEIKISYIEKPVQEMSNHNIENALDIHSMGLNCSTQTEVQTDLDTVIKKPCPLEMSIKAANIDLEFEKCKADDPIQIMQNCQLDIEKQPILVESISLKEELRDGILKVPLEITNIQQSVQVNNNIVKPTKTEITWENNNVKRDVIDNGFQESLICEVEEVNDDEDEDEDEEEDDDEEEEEKEECKEEDNEKTGESSTDESDSLPLSVALKLKQPKSKNGRSKKHKGEITPNEKSLEEDKGRRKGSQKIRKTKENESETSSESEDGLNLKRIKNEFNYKCYYEPKVTKSAASLVLKMEEKPKKFIRARNCCTKRDCGNKISVQDQKMAHKNFYELESNAKRDAYLINCIEHVPVNRSAENAKENSVKKQEKKLLENANIQLEIENESNGNQKLSDEIQNAINESLKDCIANEEKTDEDREDEEEGEVDGGEKNGWNFYIVINRCRKRVCLQFLLKLFRITKSRIKQLQKKILLGTPINEEVLKPSPKTEIWDLVKSHLYSLAGEENVDCESTPRHRFLTEPRTKEDLFSSFKLFYLKKLGTEPNIKYNSYKRFLDKKTSIAFTPNKKGVCTGCEEMRKQEKKKCNKEKKSKTKKPKTGTEKKQWVVKSDSEENSSDDEPLLKRKRLKLTIPLKAVDGKGQANGGKRNGRGSGVEKKTKGRSKKERTKHTSSRGRDVWSLMLLHLGTMPYKESSACVSKKKHRFLDSSFTTQGLFEDYRKYFLKETNSELGLGFTMYEKYFNRNCNYTIADLDVNAPNCPSCTAPPNS